MYFYYMVRSQVSLVKLKYLSDLKGRIGWQNLTTNEYTTDGAYLVAGIHLENGIINWDSCYHISEERYEMDSNIQLQNNDLLITKAGTIGKLGIVTNLKSHATINSALVIIRPKSPSKYFVKYLYYFLSSFYFQKWFLTVIKPYSTILNLSQQELSNLPIFLCSLSEQQEIVFFLDQKCDLIQELLSKIDLFLKKLGEYQQSVIYNTLIQQKSKMISLKLKYAYSFFTGFTPNTKNFSYYENGQYFWSQISDLNKKVITSTSKKISLKAIEDYKPKLTPKNSLLISFKLSLGTASFCLMDTYTNEAIASFPPENVNSLNYLYYIFPCTIQ